MKWYTDKKGNSISEMELHRKFKSTKSLKGTTFQQYVCDCCSKGGTLTAITPVLKDSWGKKVPIFFRLCSYAENKSLAIQMLTDVDGYLEMWSTLTVNLDETQEGSKDTAFVDTNNNEETIVNWLSKNSLGNYTGRLAQSGYCVYPEVKFNLDELKKHSLNIEV